MHFSFFKNLKYSFLARAVEALFTILFGITMARLIEPSDFGILAMSAIFTGISSILIDFGTGEAIIRIKKDKNFYLLLSSVFWLNLMIGFIVSLILIIFSKSVANYFGHAVINKIIILSTLNIIFSSMANVPRSLLRKYMNFKYIFFQKLLILTLSCTIGIIMALKGMGLWSIVFQQLIFNIIGTIILIYYSNWLPLFHFRTSDLKKIFSFSLNLSFSKVANYFVKKGDIFLVGQSLGDYYLGIYSRGYSLTVNILKIINSSIINVLYPKISKLYLDKKKINQSFVFTSHCIVCIYVPIVLFGLTSSSEVVTVVLGAKWSELSDLIPIFFILTLILASENLTNQYFKTLGQTDILFKLSIISSIFTVSAFYLGLKWGIIGVAVGYVLARLLHYIMLLFSLNKIMKFDKLKFFFNIVCEVFSTIIIFLSIMNMLKFLNINSALYHLFLSLLMIFFSQLIYRYIFSREFLLIVLKFFTKKS